MNRNISKLLLCAALALASCSSADEPKAPTAGEGETAKVSLDFSRTSAAEFADAGISEITVFVYHVERKGTTLYREQTIPVGDGTLDIEFPLGETYQTFAVANVPSITGKDELATVTLNLDPAAKSNVWASAVVKFATDKSDTKVALTLMRRISRVIFLPAETEAELAQVEDFDNINVTFSNIASSILVNGFKATAAETTVAAPASEGFKAEIYSFDTNSLDQNGKLKLEFTKGGAKVNVSHELDCEMKYPAGKVVTLRVPITDANVVENAWSRSSEIPFINPLKVELSEF